VSCSGVVALVLVDVADVVVVVVALVVVVMPPIMNNGCQSVFPPRGNAVTRSDAQDGRLNRARISAWISGIEWVASIDATNSLRWNSSITGLVFSW
jgi:hypothetical protein